MAMTLFEMIKYHNHDYPAKIPLRIQEIAAHFDVSGINKTLDCSLHTEYSYGKRKLNTELLQRYPELCDSHKDGVPQLWKNNDWACQFADFVIALVGGGKEPAVIEIHPPFNDYTDTPSFIKSYSCFEERIAEVFPDTEILLENRCGSMYRGGKFLVSTVQDIAKLSDAIDKEGLHMKIACDIPQYKT